MECKNHQGRLAVDRCGGCAEPFCLDCLVEIQGQRYCGDCKVIVLRGEAPPIPEEQTRPCEEANDALKYAIIGIFCFGIFVEPVAISKALKAKRMIDADPRLGGAGKATAALWIGIIALVLWVLGLLSRLSGA